MLRNSLIAVLLLASTSTVFAAQEQSRRGTQHDQQACSRDATRHCKKLLSEGDFVVLRCLQEHRPKLTRACRQVLEAHGQ